MDQERKISKKVKKHDATDPQYPYVDPDPRIVRGLTRPSSSHPHVVLGEGGLVVTIADGAEITSYTLIHDDKGVEALPRWSRQRSCALSALVDGGNGRVVAIRRHEDSSLVEIIDSDGHEHTLTEVKGSVCGSVVAGGRLFLATRRDRHVGATLFEIDLVSGHIVSETPHARKTLSSGRRSHTPAKRRSESAGCAGSLRLSRQRVDTAAGPTWCGSAAGGR
jgi:hypothetical protein